MQNSKRIQRAIKKLSEIEDLVLFYTNGDELYKREFKELRELIDELALDKKEDHARLAKKLKGLWKSQAS